MPLWPHGKRFAFSIFDDPDSQTQADGAKVYDLLHGLGYKTTKAVWPIRGCLTPSDHGETCAEPNYLRWVQQLQERGFEIAFHNATSHTSTREQTADALARFRIYFGAPPRSMANHYNSAEGIYWGDARTSGARSLLYNMLTTWKNSGKYRGHIRGDPLFWGDLCLREITYVRNFVFGNINTLAACPVMPYHDPWRPYVRAWFSATEGSDAPTFVKALSEPRIEQLEAAGGACIIYTHFGHGYVDAGRIRTDVVDLLRRLAKRPAWFVPVSELLDFLRPAGLPVTLTRGTRARLEWRWLLHKVVFGTA